MSKQPAPRSFAAYPLPGLLLGIAVAAWSAWSTQKTPPAQPASITASEFSAARAM
jgi:hypothetical protein